MPFRRNAAIWNSGGKPEFMTIFATNEELERYLEPLGTFLRAEGLECVVHPLGTGWWSENAYMIEVQVAR
jgi:hypothetical protein